MIYNIQAHLNPRWCLVIGKLNKEVCCGFIFLVPLSLGKVMMKHSSYQFDN